MPPSLQLTPGDTARVAAVDSRVRLSWRSAAPSVATVDGNGFVTALTRGNTSIWGVRGNDSAAVSVQVLAAKCAANSFISPNNAMLTVGDTVRVSSTLAGCSAFTGVVEWSVSNAEVASVATRTPEGPMAAAVVRALNAGTTIITARSAEDPTESATMAVTVRP